MKQSKYIWGICLCLLVAAFSLSACGSDEPDRRDIVGGGDGGSMDDAGLEDGESDADTDSDTGGDGTSGDDASTDSGDDASASGDDFCDAQDEGVISGNSAVFSGSFSSDDVSSTCGVSGAVDKVIEFQLDQPARVEFNVTSDATASPTVQVHSGPCESAERIVCYNSSTEVFLADDGVSYFLVVEAGETTVSSGDFEVELSLEPLGCFPSGETRCDGGDVLVCDSSFEEQTRSCAYSCTGGACGGDSCGNALDASGEGTQVFQGTLDGYTNNIDFAGRDECFEGGAISTEGDEVVFSVPGLTAGQTISVDASEEVGDDNDNAIFIVSDCSSTPTCEVGGDQLFETLEWTVEQDGDYWIVVDLLSAQSEQFHYEITVE